MHCRRSSMRFVVVLLTLWASSAAMANLRVSLTDLDSNPYATTVGKGGSFNVAVFIDTQLELLAGGFQLKDVSESGIVTLTSVTFGVAWEDDVPWATRPDVPVTLDGGSGHLSGQIGSTARDLAGEGIMATLHILVSESAPEGEYRLNLAEMFPGEGIADWLASDESTYIATFGEDYVVTVRDLAVVPAPGAAFLALIGLPIVGWVKRRFA